MLGTIVVFVVYGQQGVLDGLSITSGSNRPETKRIWIDLTI
jgi:hypothetical protein